MKKILHFILCGILMLSAAAWAEDAPTPVNVKESTLKAAANLNKLTRMQREAALAEISGLLFMPDGRRAYDSKTSYQKAPIIRRGKAVGVEQIPYRRVAKGACFVGTDGKLYDFHEALPERSSAGRKTDTWKQAKLHIHYAGKNAVMKHYEQDMRQMEKQRAVYFLRVMPQGVRQAMFAELMGLLYTENGGSPYTGQTNYDNTQGEKVPYQSVKRGAKFLNSEGATCDFFGEREEATRRGVAWLPFWNCVKLAIHHMGKDDILAPFRKEIQAMQQQVKR